MKTINKAVIEDKEAKSEMVKIRFNEIVRNRNVSLEMYKGIAEEYFKELFAENGKRVVVPNEHAIILNRVLEKHGSPYFYQPGIVYEVSDEDADFYTSKSREVLENTVGSKTTSLLLTNVARDLHRYQTKIYLAEVVND